MFKFIKNIFSKKKQVDTVDDLPAETTIESTIELTNTNVEEIPEEIQPAPSVDTSPVIVDETIPTLVSTGYPVGDRSPVPAGVVVDTKHANSTIKSKKQPMKANLPPKPNVGTNEIQTGAINIGSNLGSTFISTVNGHEEIRNQPDNQGSYVQVKVATPTKENDVTSKAYVDAELSGYTITATCDAASTGSNINLHTDVENGDAIDRFILFTNQLIMIKDQTDPKQNGIYIVSQENDPVRYSAANLIANNIFYVSQGIVNHETFWKVVGTFTGPGGAPVYGVDAINFIPVTLNPHGGSVTITGTAPINVANPSSGSYQISFGTSGVTAGTYNTLTVDANGIVTFGTNVPYSGSGTVTAITAGTGLSGGTITTSGTISIAPTGVVAGTYQGLVVNNLGQITSATNQNYGTGSVASIVAGAQLTGGTIVNSGTIALGTTSVIAGTYGNGSNIGQFTVNAYGQITSATNIATTSGFFWNNVPGTTQLMVANNGYIVSNPALTTITLPATIAQGQVVAIAGFGASGWKLAQNAGQTIHFGNTDSTTGITGFLASTNKYDYIELLCVAANTDFIVKASVGNIDIH